MNLHNAMWPGLVGKGEPGAEPAIGLDRMLALTEAARVNGRGFDGVDLFLYQPHFDIEATDDEIRRIADKVAGHGFRVGTVVAPVWEGTMGASSMGSGEDRSKFLAAVKAACRVAGVLNDHGVRSYGCIRIDSAASTAEWAKDPAAGTARIAETFREAADVAEAHGERLVAEGEVCWAGMHSWRHMLDLLEAVGRPKTLGFQADLAHTYLYMLGVNAPEHALLKPGYTTEEFWAAYATMTRALGPWTFDVHVAQSNGTVFGSGSHDKTGRHCPADAPDGKLDMVRCARAWLLDEHQSVRNGIRHLCWDGCMFPNAMLEKQETWNTILGVMLDINKAYSK